LYGLLTKVPLLAINLKRGFSTEKPLKMIQPGSRWRIHVLLGA
jgi:hypothetical protein